MSLPLDQLRVKDLGSGLRIAYRKDTADEQAMRPWIRWLGRASPRPGEPSEDAVVIDIGAHIGGFTLPASNFAPRGRVFAIEACRASYEVLRFNIELNGLKNVDAAHLAIADRIGRVRLHHGPQGNVGHSITAEHGGSSEAVESVTLRGYMDQRGIDRCDLLKLNCEGAEFPILMTASHDDLRRIQQIAVFYHVDFVDDSYSLTGLERRLEDAGFSLGPREGGKTHGWFIASLGE